MLQIFIRTPVRRTPVRRTPVRRVSAEKICQIKNAKKFLPKISQFWWKIDLLKTFEEK